MNVPLDSRVDGARPIGDLSLVEIASELESVTSEIERHRAREREARAQYEQIAGEVSEQIASIRDRAAELIGEQQRRMSSFGGIIRTSDSPAPPQAGFEPGPGESGFADSGPGTGSGTPRTLGDAILRVYETLRATEPLTSDDLLDALPATGYETRATPRSQKSSLNQAIAKLCQEKLLLRYRNDGSPIDPRERGVRARRYLPANMVQDHPALNHPV